MAAASGMYSAQNRVQENKPNLQKLILFVIILIFPHKTDENFLNINNFSRKGEATN